MWEGTVLATTPGTIDMRQAMRYSLSLPVSTVIIGCVHRPVRRERAIGARVHSAQPAADGGAHRENTACVEAGAVLSLLRTGVIRFFGLRIVSFSSNYSNHPAAQFSLHVNILETVCI
jgi:hypothetical protein